MVHNHGINERSQHLLHLLVQRYIKDGQPVGFSALCKELSLSSASIRNIMSELEEFGFLKSPHTSAGRIPTEKSYRLFVNNLIQAEKIDNQDSFKQVKNELNLNQTTNDLIQSASQLMSNLTHLAGVVSTPKRPKSRLRHIEFFPLSSKRILTVLVLNNREVHNRIIQTQREFNASELQTAANYINAAFAGNELSEIRKKLRSDLKSKKNELNNLMRSAINLTEQSLNDKSENNEYILCGESNLLDITDPNELDNLKSLLDAFSEKKATVHLFDHCLNADDVQIFIGKESGHQVFDDWSIVTAPYFADGDILGVLGVIGPQRMAYDKVISIVDVTAKLITATLKE